MARDGKMLKEGRRIYAYVEKSGCLCQEVSMAVHVVTECRLREFDVLAAQMRAMYVCLYEVKPFFKK